jgi:hypothetical protein
LLVRWSAPLADGSHAVAGLVLANLFSLAAWVICCQRVHRRWGPDVAAWAMVFLLVFPGSLFFQFLYSESLFFLLVMLLWWGLEDRLWGMAWTAAVLLPMTRAVGLFAVLPIAWHALSTSPPGWARLRLARWGIGNHGDPAASPSSRTDQVPTGGHPCQPWLLLAAPLLGWGTYLGLMWHWTGNPFEGFEAQKSWGVHSIGNLVNIPKFVIGFFMPTEWHEFRGSLLDRGMFVVLLYTLPVIWRLDKGLLVWTYWLGILPAMSGTFTSYTRYASCVFPVFIALAAFFTGIRATGNMKPVLSHSEPGANAQGAGPSSPAARPSPRLPWLRWGLLAAFAALHIVLVWRFLNFRWAG